MALEIGAQQSRIHVKLFVSGNIQIVGMKDLHVGEELVRFLSESLQHSVQHFNVNLINVTTSMFQKSFEPKHLPIGLDRHALHNIVCNHHPPPSIVYSEFDPSQWPGVKLHFDVNGRHVFAGIFATGKVVITGANTLDQIHKVHDMLMDMCRTYQDRLFIYSSTSQRSSFSPQAPTTLEDGD
jgi:TATA-box binding protein (TBP) (component of TFIID and TFIIIB)